ncbi:hypothetical protein H8B06_05320 [Sphingobacterium sp. DN00404]|uniref:Uncharacterized protein n=1 Tax=Sphingobacterium micropteri TaxID=2763501 RepID=A0ABR7YM36_9SPHI|nr:hypothetical protein [Sphingobacterium micropteri]MBD1432238.1 hypothetical protein [Sphingobacterium micropteri]
MELSIDSRPRYEDRTVSGINAWVSYFFLMIIVSCYFFPFEFTFLPKGLNTKIILAGLGVPILAFNSIYQRGIWLSVELIPAILLALVFSLIGYISVDVNKTNDYTYANYLISFATWLLGAYTVCSILRKVHGYLNFDLLINYLIAVSIVQCSLALAIDNIVSLKNFIDTYISQDTVADVEFLNKVDRLYGIGAALDVAGTRFSIVLIGLVTVLHRSKEKYESISIIALYWIAFVAIAVIGNMISRTTTVGVLFALLYLLLSFDVLNQEVSFKNVKSWATILGVTFILVVVAMYFYRTDENIRGLLRFGFEGFFNWVEKGKWTTSSTERLNTVMWIWPDVHDYRTWLIGKATFDNWYVVGTDIGYCRFIFYSGLLGLITFSLFFVYNAWMGIRKFPCHKLFFILLLALGFIIWLKVSTDLFLIYSLFYFLDKDEGSVV